MNPSSDIREHMEVVGSDGKHVGTVDHLEGGRVKLTKSDPNADGKHHYLSIDQVDRVEKGRVCLNLPCDKAMQAWQS